MSVLDCISEILQALAFLWLLLDFLKLRKEVERLKQHGEGKEDIS